MVDKKGHIGKQTERAYEIKEKVYARTNVSYSKGAYFITSSADFQRQTNTSLLP